MLLFFTFDHNLCKVVDTLVLLFFKSKLCVAALKYDPQLLSPGESNNLTFYILTENCSVLLLNESWAYNLFVRKQLT